MSRTMGVQKVEFQDPFGATFTLANGKQFQCSGGRAAEARNALNKIAAEILEYEVTPAGLKKLTPEEVKQRLFDGGT